MISACESLNARAIAFMKIGDDEGARSMLLSALHLLKGVVGHEKGLSLATQGEEHEHSLDVYCCENKSEAALPRCGMHYPNESFHLFPSKLPPTCTHHQNGFQHAMYNAAFVYLSPITSPTFDLLREQTRISAVILYNLALTHHLRWIESGCSIELNQASRLYKTALASAELCCSGPADDVSLVSLAILNNLGVLYAENFDYTDSTYLGGQAIAFINWIDARNLLNHDDYLFFQTNALILRKLSEASAAAA